MKHIQQIRKRKSTKTIICILQIYQIIYNFLYGVPMKATCLKSSGFLRMM